MILGEFPGQARNPRAVLAQFDRRIPDMEAVYRFHAFGQRKPPRHLVKLRKVPHKVVFAPSGAGKGVSLVIPELLDNPQSFIVLDPKGENYNLTASHRAKKFGHKIVAIDPFRIVTDKPTPFNALNPINPNNPESFAQIRALAEALIIKDPQAREPHWAQKAEVITTGVISAVVHFFPPQQRSLQLVASIMADRGLLNASIQKLKESKAYNGLLARLGGEMSNPSEKEMDGIISTANRSLAFLTDPAIVENTVGLGGYDPDELDNITVYLILPFSRLRSCAGITRLWFASIMRAAIDRGTDKAKPLNILMDEAACLGNFEAAFDMLNFGRGFGLQGTFVYQSMGQLMTCWPNGQHQTFLSSTSQILFAVNDPQTAEYVSSRLGDETILVEDYSTNQSDSKPDGPNTTTTRSSGQTRSQKQIAHRLLKPDQVIASHPRVAFCFTPGVPPIATWLTRYYEPKPRKTGPVWVAVNSVALFIAVAFVSALFTALLFKG